MRKKSIAEKNSTAGIVCKSPWRITKVTPQPNYTLEIEFMDGTHGLVEMLHLVTSENAGVFSILKDITHFNKVYLEYGAVTWPGEIDLAPDALYDEIKKHGKAIL